MSAKNGMTRIRIELYLAIAAMLWTRYRAPRAVQEIVGYTIFSFVLSVTAYYCFQAVRVRFKNNHSFGEFVLFARAKSPPVFYAGVLAVWIAFVVNGAFLFKLINHTNPNVEVWWGIAFGSFALGFLYSWLGAYQFRLSTSRIDYWSLFGGFRSMSSDEIERARIRTGWFNYWDRYRPTVRLEILGSKLKERKPIIMNLKVFCEKDVNQVFDWLGHKLQDPGNPMFSSRKDREQHDEVLKVRK